VKSRRFWTELILTAAALSCAVGLLIASLGAAAGASAGKLAVEVAANPAPAPAAQNSPEESYEGMVTDTQCGAKHRASIGKTASDCTRACVHGGAQFALVDGDKSYVLSGDSELLKRLAGSRARVMGTRRGDTIAISSGMPDR